METFLFVLESSFIRDFNDFSLGSVLPLLQLVVTNVLISWKLFYNSIYVMSVLYFHSRV